MNVITVHGRLTREPEIKDYESKKGKGKMATFTVASDRRFGDDPDFFDCALFGDKRADVFGTHFHKGQEIVLMGELNSRTVESDGVKRKYWTINVDQFDFCGSKQDGMQQIEDDAPF